MQHQQEAKEVPEITAYDFDFSNRQQDNNQLSEGGIAASEAFEETGPPTFLAKHLGFVRPSNRALQPAFRSYLFGPAWNDWESTINHAWHWGTNYATNTIGTEFKKQATDSGHYASASAAVLWTTMAGWYAAAFVCLCLLASAHALVLVFCWFVALLAVGCVNGADFLFRAWFRVGHPCVNSGCYDRSLPPEYLCSACGRAHSRLIPGMYGFLTRHCACGHHLPTLHINGRAALECRCASCKLPLANRVATDLHVMLTGGPSSGKTCLLLRQIQALEAGASSGGYKDFGFGNANEERSIRAMMQLLQKERRSEKTRQNLPRAIELLLTPLNGTVPRCLHFYDAAGESLHSSDTMTEQAYIGHANGILFVLDPFSLAPDTDVIKLPAHACRLSPEEAYARLALALTARQGSLHKTGWPVRLAVVVTKVDTLGGQLQPGDTGAAVRRYLEDAGGGNILRALSADFREVEYFAVNSFDQGNEANQTALRPLLWVLRRRLPWRVPTSPAASPANT